VTVSARDVILDTATTDAASLASALPAGRGRVVLESGACGPLDARRRTVIASEPAAIVVAWGDDAYIEASGRRHVTRGGAVEALGALWPTLDAAGQGVGIGCFSYDLVRRIERLPTIARDDECFPDLWLGIYDVVVVVEDDAVHLKVQPVAGREVEAEAKAVRWSSLLARAPLLDATVSERPSSPVRSSLTRDAYHRAVERTLDYIAAGDVYQVNVTQRLRWPCAGDPWNTWRRLRQTCPAPFSAYLDLGDRHVLSASPERLVFATPAHIETRPIKGTLPRGRDADTDRAQSAALLASAKDAAELVMIVDMARNDLGRVALPDTVHVRELRRLEPTPSVWHTVATVEAMPRLGIGPADVLRAVFPGASVTGAPKVRAMEIIESLEPDRRGLYTGSIGYIGLDGAMDLSVAIRTAVLRSGVATLGVGGGIVADSSPAAEYEECWAKAQGPLAALGGYRGDVA